MRAMILGWCSACHGPTDGWSCRSCGSRPELFAVEVSDPPKVLGGRDVYRDLVADLDQAKAVRDDICARLARGSLPADSEVPVRRFCEQEWLPTVKPEVAESTYRSYRGELARHVWPHLGGTALAWMSYRKVSAWMDQLDADGRTDGRGGLSPRTVNYVRQILHRALDLAVTRGYVAHNPCPPASRVRGPGQSRTTGPRTRRARTWTDDQLRTFLARNAGDRLYAAWRLVASCGLWRGEVLGLRWTDVDLDAGKLTVTQKFVTANGHRSFGNVTGHARRTIALDQALVFVLEDHRDRQGAERRTAGDRWEEHGLVVCQPNGRPIDPDNFSKTFDRHVRRARLPKMTLSDLRNLHAARLLENGTDPEVVAQRLGHANGDYTLRTISERVGEGHVNGVPIPDPPTGDRSSEGA